MIPIYKKDQFTHFIAKDNCYVYLVQPTPVDKHIISLFHYINRCENVGYFMNEEQVSEIKSSLQKVNEEEIKGWVVMKANRMFNNL